MQKYNNYFNTAKIFFLLLLLSQTLKNAYLCVMFNYKIIYNGKYSNIHQTKRSEIYRRIV